MIVGNDKFGSRTKAPENHHGKQQEDTSLSILTSLKLNGLGVERSLVQGSGRLYQNIDSHLHFERKI